MKTKSLFESKTATFNFIVAAVAVVAFFIPQAAVVVQENAVFIMGALGLVNIGLRRITNSAWTLFPLLALCFVCFGLTSCASNGGSGPSSEQLDAGYQLLRLIIEPTK